MDDPVERFKRVDRDARKVYSPPKLTEYGHVEKLTRGATGSGAELGRKLTL